MRYAKGGVLPGKVDYEPEDGDWVIPLKQMRRVMWVNGDRETAQGKRGRVMEVRINLNESVKFKLSERGKEIYRHRYGGLEPNLDDDGYMSMQLWTFMWLFGDHMTPGMSEVVQPLEIIYEQEDE